MNEMFLLKLGEVVLKGQNRRTFEDKLRANIRRRMAFFGDFKVYIIQSTAYVEPLSDSCDLDGAWEACGTIFGIATRCRCRPCEKNLDDIFRAVMDYLGPEIAASGSFKVESKRSDKAFPYNSIQISQEIGGRLAEAFPNVPVDVHSPGYTVGVEVRDYAAYIHGPAVPGAGGLPMGSLAGAKWGEMAVPAAVVTAGALFFCTQYRTLNLMLLGDETAVTLGTKLSRWRTGYLVCTSAMIGVVVCEAGMIGFVGLLVPHIVRILSGTDHRRLVPLSCLAGSIFLVWADVAARSVLKSGELPIGILVSLIGAPFFLWLVFRKTYSFGGGGE